jgi:glycosyltransferase involved in cell wall biosynthesis
MVHPRRWQAEVLQECRTFGVNPRDCDTVLPDGLIARREQEYRLCDRIVVPSTVAADSFVEKGLSNVEIILPGVDTHFFSPAVQPNNSRTFRVCYAGRLELAKGVQYLLEAWQRLKLPDAELVLLGDVRPEIQSTMRQRMLPGVTLKGFVPRNQLAEEYRRSSVFVFPSLHEGLAQTILEAMACGLPVIATASSGAEDCISDGLEGFITKARNVDELASKIELCYQNRGALLQMGRAARAKVETTFSIEQYHARVISTYRRLSSPAA